MSERQFPAERTNIVNTPQYLKIVSDAANYANSIYNQPLKSYKIEDYVRDYVAFELGLCVLYHADGSTHTLCSVGSIVNYFKYYLDFALKNGDWISYDALDDREKKP